MPVQRTSFAACSTVPSSTHKVRGEVQVLLTERENRRPALADAISVASTAVADQRQSVCDVMAELEYSEIAVAIGLAGKQVLTRRMRVEDVVQLVQEAVDQMGTDTIRTITREHRAATCRMRIDGPRPGDDHMCSVKRIWGTLRECQTAHDLAYRTRVAASVAA